MKKSMKILIILMVIIAVGIGGYIGYKKFFWKIGLSESLKKLYSEHAEKGYYTGKLLKDYDKIMDALDRRFHVGPGDKIETDYYICSVKTRKLSPEIKSVIGRINAHNENMLGNNWKKGYDMVFAYKDGSNKVGYLLIVNDKGQYYVLAENPIR